MWRLLPLLVVSGCVSGSVSIESDRPPVRLIVVRSSAIDPEPAPIRGRAGERYRSGEVSPLILVPLERFLWIR